MKAAIAPVLEADRPVACAEHPREDAAVWIIAGGQAVPVCQACALELRVQLEAAGGLSEAA